MKIVVTGGNGYVGSAIVGALKKREHEVISPHRSDGFDIAQPESFASLVAGADAVIHAAIDGSPDAATIDRRFVESILEMQKKRAALDERRRRFIYTSGIWVLGDTGDRIADESTPPTNPAKLVSWRPAVERIVIDASDAHDRSGAHAAFGVDGWVVRPAIVYGGRGGIIGMMIDELEKKGTVTIVGDGSNRWPLIHRDDLGELYARVLDLAPSQKILHATDSSILTVHQIATELTGGDVSRIIKTFPDDSPFAQALILDQRVSSALTTRALNFSPQRALSKQPSMSAFARSEQIDHGITRSGNTAQK